MDDEFKNFLDAVREMREAQRAYFKHRAHETLLTAKDRERAVDAMLARLLRAEPVTEKEAKLL